MVAPEEQRGIVLGEPQQARIGRLAIRPIDAYWPRAWFSRFLSVFFQRLVYEHFKFADIAKWLAHHSCIAQFFAKLQLVGSMLQVSK